MQDNYEKISLNFEKNDFIELYNTYQFEVPVGNKIKILKKQCKFVFQIVQWGEPTNLSLFMSKYIESLRYFTFIQSNKVRWQSIQLRYLGRSPHERRINSTQCYKYLCSIMGGLRGNLQENVVARFEIHPTHRNQTQRFNLFGVPLQLDNWMQNQNYVPMLNVKTAENPTLDPSISLEETQIKAPAGEDSKELPKRLEERIKDEKMYQEFKQASPNPSPLYEPKIWLPDDLQTSVAGSIQKIEQFFIQPIEITPINSMLFMPLTKIDRNQYVPYKPSVFTLSAVYRGLRETTIRRRRKRKK